MPVRSLSSSVIRWPEVCEVIGAVRQWARETATRHPEAVRIGYFGSYARGDWGVGSDIDLIIIVSGHDDPGTHRFRDWQTGSLPVPADVLVYTEEEWRSMCREGYRITEGPITWVYQCGNNDPPV